MQNRIFENLQKFLATTFSTSTDTSVPLKSLSTGITDKEITLDADYNVGDVDKMNSTLLLKTKFCWIFIELQILEHLSIF
ncbi:hypothetical protein skT53_03660 [Effusibacillus dendaii]|uniref:Uncharacterized protein n=1 Tax=Effusibacillus dendaii TaxID=2743772 RepID=A0A7I8DBS9_9BACL|nr:hypothetical protein skT53_03660 [Effusibacillus dendaii]